MTDANAAIDYRHPGMLLHQALQPRPATRDDEIDNIIHTQELRNQRMIGGRNQLHGIERDTNHRAGLANHIDEHLVCAQALFAPAHDDGIAGLDGQSTDIDRDVGTRLKYDA